MEPNGPKRQTVEELAEEFVERYRRGERPPLSEFTARDPEHADEIRDLFPALVMMEQIAPDSMVGSLAPTHASLRGRPIEHPERLGDYRILGEIGRGGMGVVYEAEQVSLGRHVALKVLPQQFLFDARHQKRFEREAKAAARLHHTNIVPVFGIGEENGLHYYVMQFIAGLGLDQVLDELKRLCPAPGGTPTPGTHEGRLQVSARRASAVKVAQSLLTGVFRQPDGGNEMEAGSQPRPGDAPLRHGEAPPPVGAGPVIATGRLTDSYVLSASMEALPGQSMAGRPARRTTYWQSVAHIGAQVATGLEYAHQQGVLHRDIKPANLLLDLHGNVWITDFGLAKSGGQENLTATGDVVGTLRYMAPEAFDGQHDARSEVCALGLALYELLALQPAFDETDRQRLIRQVTTAEPPRLGRINHAIPRDLVTIVHKAIDRNPARRYQTAALLAEDLQRFLRDEPVLARRIGVPEQYLRWARRNPVVAVLGGVLTAVLVVATVASVLATGRMAALMRQNNAGRREVDRLRDRAERSLYGARIALAENALRRNDPASAATLLDACLPKAAGPDRRGWEWSYLERWCRPELRTLRIPNDRAVFGLVVSPDSRFLVAVGGNPYYYGAAYEGEPASVHVYDLPGLGLRRTLAGHWDKAGTVAFRPDGKRLATAAPDSRVRLWDTETWRELRTFDGGITERPPRVEILGWSPDGRRLAIRIHDSVWIGDPETMRTTARIAEAIEGLTWSPDGKRIAAIMGSGGVQVWDVENGGRLGPPLEAGSGVVRRVFWASPGQRLTGFRTDGMRRTWDLATGQVLEDKAVVPELAEVEFSHDGSFFVTGGNDGLLRVVDTASGNIIASLFHGASSIRALALSPDGSRLFVGGLGVAGVKVFDPRRDPGGRIAPAQWQLCALAFDERGDMLRTINWEGNSDGANLEIYDLAGGTPHPGPRLPVSNRDIYPRGDFAFASDGRRLAAPKNGDDSAVGIWDVVTGREIATLRASGMVAALAFEAEGGRLAIGAWDRRRVRGEVAIWDIASGRVIRTIDAGPHPIRAVAFSADGRRVAAGGGGESRTDDSGWAVAWDGETGARLITLDRAGMITSLAFDHDGTRVAAVDFARQNLHIWDLKSGAEIRGPAPAAVSSVAFTPDGRRVASVGYDGQVHLADARTGEELLVLRSAATPNANLGFTPRLTFSKDGSQLAANGVKEVSFWEISAQAGPEPEPAPAQVTGWLRQGRALAGQGDAAGAEAAYARARELDDGDPSPWIEHALSLWRRGESPQARDALDRAVSALPDDPGHWADLGRLLDRFGWMEESETARAKARSLAEQRLSHAPDDEVAITALAEALPDAVVSRGWTVLQPTTMTSVAGVALTRLPDGSVLAGGLNPPVDTYTVEAVTPFAGITGIRLEALADPSLPHRGPGRADNGSFLLNGIRLTVVTDPKAAVPVRMSRFCSGVSQYARGLQGVIGLLGTGPKTGRSIGLVQGRAQSAVFQLGKPNETCVGARLRVELDSGDGANFAANTLGRFRLSVTSRPVPFFEASLSRIKADAQRNGLTRLGAAYSLLGDWASAATVLGRNAARSDASALDGFLAALAQHHLGQRAEARSGCDRAVERLRTCIIEDEARNVALEALTAIRDLGIDEAESLLLDAAFPADPFAR
jgi:eukaryotic-like serine/threonine-protein kinase